MLQGPEGGSSSRGRCRCPQPQSDGERLRSMRERLELVVSALGELEKLRVRQQLLVLSALEEEEERLVLRKQLSCLRRDAGLVSELHELDQQINELRLDPDLSHDQLETDSRPSSGFYELSDVASGSLSNSSHSVFSECFCSTAEAEGYFLSSEELASCLEHDARFGGFYDDSGSSVAVRRSLSAPHQASLEAISLVPANSPTTNLGSLFSRNVSDIHCRSPLHAAAAQASGFQQIFRDGGHCRDEAFGELLKTETSTIPGSVSGSVRPQSCTLQTHSRKHLEKYIFALLQRRAQPIKANRTRTSISVDPLRSIVRQPSRCLRQTSGPCSGVGTLTGSEIRPLFTAKETSIHLVAISSLQTQCPVEAKNYENSNHTVFPDSTDIIRISSNVNNVDSNSLASHNQQNNCSPTSVVQNTSVKRDISKRCKWPPSLSGTSANLLNDISVQKNPKHSSSVKETSQQCCFTDQEILKSVLTAKTQTGASKKITKPVQSGASEDYNAELVVESKPVAQKLEEGIRLVRRSHLGSGNLAKQRNGKHHRGNSRNGNVTKVKSTNRTNTMLAYKHKEVSSEKRGHRFNHNSGAGRILEGEDESSHCVKVSNKGSSSETKNLSASAPKTGVQDKDAPSTQVSVRSGVLKQHQHESYHSHHHPGREQIILVAKPKYKRNDHRPLHAIMEVPHDSANKHAQRRQRKKVLRNSAAKTYPSTGGQQGTPHVAGSDSEYSAECVSLFHSTIVDTSEDDRSNYTTNCFGDSESSEEEYVEENTTTDTEESVGGGAVGEGGGTGRRRVQLRTARLTVRKLEMDPAQSKAFVKIKASYNLKRKILRFKSGSLKLMTTV